MKIMTGAALAIALLAAAACGRRTAPLPTANTATADPGIVVLPADSPMLKQIACARVRSAELPTDELIAPGKIEANPARVSKIALPVAGRIAAVLVRQGDTVVRGQPLLAVQSPDADSAMSAYASAQALAMQSESALTKARADFDRATDLFAHDAIAKKDVQSGEAALVQAQAALDQARAAREQALRRLSVLGLQPGDFDQQVVVRSPLAGKILEVTAVAGEYRTDTSAAVLTVADLTTVWVTSQVPEGDIRFVQRGEQVDISLVAYPGETFVGHVARIADTVDPQTRTIKVQAELDNRDGRLRPEMYGTIRHVEAIATTLVVPVGAVVQNEHEAVVFVETAPGRFEQRKVEIGKRAGDVVRIAGGIAAGDVIAVDGVMLLKGLAGRT